jgi:hypothetical protein
VCVCVYIYIYLSIMIILAEVVNGITWIQVAPASKCSGYIAILAAAFRRFPQVYQANGKIVA